MSEIEDEIRRQLLAEREAQLRNAQNQGQSSSQSTSEDDSLLQRQANGFGPTPTVDPALNGTDTRQPYYANPQPSPSSQPGRRVGTLQRWKNGGGILGGIATALLAFFKVAGPILAVLGKLKYLGIVLKLLLTIGTMFLSILAYAHYYGLGYGIGFVMLIFIHECGHVLGAKLRGVKTGIMMFIPFMGAFVMKGYGRSLTNDAFIGIMGPAVGTFASVVTALIYYPTHDPFWLALASWGFFINLFNLFPTPPLDGGWISPLFSPKLMAVGAIAALIAAVAIGINRINPLIWILLLLSLPRIIAGWKADPKTQPYYQVPVIDKWKYGFAYVGLAGFLAFAGHEVDTALHTLVVM
jgi:Zn-dependent protease